MSREEYLKQVEDIGDRVKVAVSLEDVIRPIARPMIVNDDRDEFLFDVIKYVIEKIRLQLQSLQPTHYAEVEDMVLIKVLPTMEIFVSSPIDFSWMQVDSITEIPPKAMAQKMIALELKETLRRLKDAERMLVHDPLSLVHDEFRSRALAECYHGCVKCYGPPRFFINIKASETLKESTLYFCDEHGDFNTLEAIAKKLGDGEVGEYWGPERACIDCDGSGEVGTGQCYTCKGSGWVDNDQYDRVTGGEK